MHALKSKGWKSREAFFGWTSMQEGIVSFHGPHLFPDPKSYRDRRMNVSIFMHDALAFVVVFETYTSSFLRRSFFSSLFFFSSSVLIFFYFTVLPSPSPFFFLICPSSFQHEFLYVTYKPF